MKRGTYIIMSNWQFACIRWIDAEFVIHEDLIGLMHVEKTDANTLTTAIKDVLIRCSLPLSQCRGQGYDGASTMMGHLTGVATQLKKEEPSACNRGTLLGSLLKSLSARCC